MNIIMEDTEMTRRYACPTCVQGYCKEHCETPRPEKALLTGEEVMDILGLPPGEEVGKALQSLHEAQIRKEVNSKEEARAFVKKR